MMNNDSLVVGLLEVVLGPGKKDKNGKDYTFYCPFCKHHKPKLVVNVESGMYNCWTCHPPTKGRNPVSLFKKLAAHPDYIKEMKTYFGSSSSQDSSEATSRVSLPIEFIPLYDTQTSTFDRDRALLYLKSRGVSEIDIKKYNIGFCPYGRYENRVIVPSYDKNGILNYFVARSINANSSRKYDTPSCKKSDIIGMENMINWRIPIILCEGAFDAIAIKRNALPLFGKTIPSNLMKKLVDSEVKTIYLALDKDALKDAISHSELLLNYGKDVYLLDLKGKDPSKIGFEGMIKLLHCAELLTFTNLYRKKLELL